ncbi:HEAT repeat domain-containing protein [Thermomonospora amylolytica]|uniref:HEAT repeat domain-containing protein n=1 Tax=Thermomonospora amylolytica TaxID=1411117 RepID=UPI0013002E81|nr:HEAT repeat domain-containing protein [Thermomonospora amylolytica]
MAGIDDYLGSVDWENLPDSYGGTADVPRYLRSLALARPKEWDAVYEALYERLVNQGSRFAASAYAVPVIVGVLGSLPERRKVALLRLLSYVAVGEDQAYLRGDFNPAEARRDLEAGRHLSWAGSGLRVERAEMAAYDAVMRETAVVGGLLTDESPQVRMWAAYLLGLFPEKAEDTVPVLRAALARESDPEAAATTAIAAGLVGSPDDASVASLLETRLRARHRLERWGAAIGLAWWDGKPSSLVARTLDECIDLGRSQSVEVPFYGGCIDVMASLAKEGRHRRR